MRVVPELLDERMLLEGALHESSLHAAASSVNEPDLAKAGPVRLAQVLFHHGDDFARREVVQVDGGLYRNVNRFVVHGWNVIRT